jgi:hypothetical protein
VLFAHHDARGMPGIRNIGYYPDGLNQCIMNHRAAVITRILFGILPALYFDKKHLFIGAEEYVFFEKQVGIWYCQLADHCIN